MSMQRIGIWSSLVCLQQISSVTQLCHTNLLTLFGNGRSKWQSIGMRSTKLQSQRRMVAESSDTVFSYFPLFSISGLVQICSNALLVASRCCLKSEFYDDDFFDSFGPRRWRTWRLWQQRPGHSFPWNFSIHTFVPYRGVGQDIANIMVNIHLEYLRILY